MAKAEKRLEELKGLEFELECGISSLLEHGAYGAVLALVESDNPDKAMGFLEKKLRVNAGEKTFQAIRVKKKLGEIAEEYADQFGADFIGQFLKEAKYQDTILLIRADCDTMGGDVDAFALEIVSDSQGIALKEVSKEKNVYPIFVLTPEDHGCYVSISYMCNCKPVMISASFYFGSCFSKK